jgi:hypothetical protein
MLVAERIVLNPRPIAIIGVSPKSFGFYFHADQVAAGNRMLGLAASDADAVRAVVPGAADALDLSGSSHYRNWLIAALQVVRNFSDHSGLAIALGRFRAIQVFETAYQYAYQKRLDRAAARAFTARLSARERGLFALVSAVFRLTTLTRRNLHDRLFTLFRIYGKPSMDFHDIGDHRRLADAWDWLARRSTSADEAQMVGASAGSPRATRP